MNKKFLFFIMAALCIILSISAFAADTVYVDGAGTAENCYATLADAVSAVDNGGTVVLTVDFTSTATVNLAAKDITITSQNNAVFKLKHALKLGGNTTFKNIKIDNARTATNYLYCCGNDLTVCEDATLTNSGGKTLLIFAGGNSKTACDLNNTITVKSGAWGNVYLGGYYATDVCSGNVTLNVYGSGTSIGTLKLGNYNNVDMDVNATVNFFDGTLSNITQTTDAAKYKYTVNLFGGTATKISVPVNVDLTNGGTVTISDENGQTVTTTAADGYEVVKSGTTYSVQKVETVAPTTVYVDGTGATAGTYTTFEDAFTALSSEGGTVIVCGDTQLGTTSKGVNLGNYNDFTGKVTITSENGAKLIFARSMTLNTDIEFKNIHIHCIIPSNLTANNNILARGNKFIVCEDVTMTKDEDAIYPTVVGGYTSATTYDSYIVIKSGAWQNIYGGGFSNTFAGNSYVEVSNTTVVGTISTGNRAGTFSGNGTLVIDLRGDKTVSATSFSENPTILVDEGYEAVLSNGTYLQREPIVADVIYVDGTGNTEGAYTSLAEAIVAYTGGEIVVCGDTTVSGELFVPEKEKDIVISSKNGAVLTLSANVSFAKNTNDTSVTFNLPVKANDAKIFGGFRNVTFTENFSVDGKLDFFGGVDTSALTENADAITEKEYTVTVNGGTFENFALGSYRYEYKHMVGSIAAPVTLNVNGGTFNSSFSVSGMAIIADNVTLNITGGTFNCPIYVRGGMGTVNTNGVKASQTVNSDRKYYAIDGDIAVNISGGTFNGGLIGAYEEQTAYTQVIRGAYTVSIIGGTFAEGTVFDATQVKAYANSDKKATITYPDTYNFSVVRFDNVNGSAVTYDEPIRIAYIGDSITEGYVSKDRLTDSYPAVIDKLAAEKGTVDLVSSNYGISASGILTSASYRFTDYLGYSLILEETDADYIVIAIGTNDSPAGGTTGALNTFAENYSNLVGEVGAIPTTKKVFVTNALVRDNENSGQIRVTSVVRPLQERMAKEFAAKDANKYVFVDLYRLTLPYAAEDKLLSSDNLHPNTAGYATMANVLYGVIFEGNDATPDTYYSNDVYVSTSGKPFASGTKDDPISRLDIAFSMLPAGEEATVHIIGKVAFAESLYTPITPSKLTIVGEGSGAILENGSASFKLGSDIKFDNITLATADSTEFYGCYYDVEMTDTVSLTGDWSFFAGHNIYAEGATNAAHDTVASASSDEDCTIILKANGTFTNFALGNRRCVGKAPFGTYSGNLTAYIGDNITITGTEHVGIIGQNYLTGNITVEMPEELVLPEYAPTYTVTSPIVYDSTKNTGIVTVITYKSTPAIIPTTVYLDGTGATDGAYTDFKAAVSALKNGGTVIVCGDTQIGTTGSGGGVTLDAVSGKVKVVSENSAVLTIARSLSLSSEMEFDNIIINSISTSIGNIFCRGNKLTIGSGVTVTVGSGAVYPALFGGASSGTVNYDTCMEVYGGTWRAIYGANYGGTLTGNSTLVIGNAVCNGKLSAANFSGTFNGNATLTIDLRGGKTVSAGTYVSVPVFLVDEGYEAVLDGGVYSQRELAPAPKLAYVDGVGEAEGYYKDLASAVAALRNGGTVVVSGKVKVDSETTLLAGGKVLITSRYEDEDYTDTAVLELSSDIVLNTAVTFKDITLDKVSSSNVNIVAMGNELVIDEGVYCRNTLASNYIILVGGAKSGTFEGNSNITVKSGYFRNIYGGNTNGTFKGNSTVNFLGGYVDNMVTGGSFMGNFEGDAAVNVGGDAVFVGTDTAVGIIGGCCGSGSGQYTFVGDIHLNFYGSSRVNSSVYGTTRYSNVTTTGNVYITVKDDAYIYSNLYAGGYNGTLNGNTSVVIDSGWVGVNLSAGSRSGTVNGDTYLEVNGGQINYYFTNYHSSYSKTAGEYNVGGGGLTGSVNGNTTVVINGGDIYGNVYGGALSTGTVSGNSTVTLTGGSIMCGAYADGKTAGSVAGTKTLNIDLSKGGTLSLGLAADVNTFIGGGSLVLAPEATITADTFSGSVALSINGVPQARDYISATSYEGASVAYTAQDTEKFVSNAGKFSVSSEGYFEKTKVIFKHLKGVEIYPRAGLVTSGDRMPADEKYDESTVFYLTPGLYNYAVYHSAEDYKRKYIYITGKEEEIVLDFTNYTPLVGEGYEAAHFTENTEEIYEKYYNTDSLVGYKTPDTPYFANNRIGKRLFTSNEEANAFIAAKVASCSYAYSFDLFTSIGGTTIPVVVFTKDNIPENATLEDVARIVNSKDGRDILMVTAIVHGNEPSGGEGALAYISEMCGEYGESFLTDNVGAVIVIPRVNPDGCEAFTRNSPNATGESNLNRDYMMLSSPEISAVVKVIDAFAPTVAIDCHEAPLDPQWGESFTLTDIYDAGLVTSATLNTSLVDSEAVLRGDYANRGMSTVEFITEAMTNIEKTGLRTYYYNSTGTAPATFTGYSNTKGTLGITLEVPGINAGDAVYARRVFAQVTSIKEIFELAKESNGAYAKMIRDSREETALSAQKFGVDTPIVLETAYSRHDSATPRWSNPLLAADGTMRNADNITKYYYQDIAVKYRSRPTAYVVKADLAGIDNVLSLFDKHGINYYKLESGATLTLKQYSGDSTAAKLSAAADVTFENGAYIVPVDGYKAYVTAILFEPEYPDSGENKVTFAQMGYLTASDIYRSEESFIAAKLGLSGTYIELATNGKMLANAVVDGETYENVDVEGDNAYVVRADDTITLNFTDGTSETYYYSDIPGDIDGDRNVTIADALTLIRAIVNDETIENGDVNGDGKVGLADTIRILKLITQ